MHSMVLTIRDRKFASVWFDGVQVLSDKPLLFADSLVHGWYTGNNTGIHRITIHSRFLTHEEVAHNYETDRKRFNI